MYTLQKTILLLILCIWVTSPLEAHGVAVFTVEGLRVMGSIALIILALLLSLLFWKETSIVNFIWIGTPFLLLVIFSAPILKNINENIEGISTNIHERIERYEYKEKRARFKEIGLKYDKALKDNRTNVLKSLNLLKEFKRKLLNENILILKNGKIKDIFHEEDAYHNKYKDFVAKKILYLAVLKDASLIGDKRMNILLENDYRNFYKKYQNKFSDEKKYINFLNQYKSNFSYIDFDTNVLFLDVLNKKQYDEAYHLLLSLTYYGLLISEYTLGKTFEMDKHTNSHQHMNTIIKRIDYSNGKNCFLSSIVALYVTLEKQSDLDYFLNETFKKFKEECKDKELELNFFSKDKRECRLYEYSKKNPMWIEIYKMSKDFSKIDEKCRY